MKHETHDQRQEKETSDKENDVGVAPHLSGIEDIKIRQINLVFRKAL